MRHAMQGDGKFHWPHANGPFRRDAAHCQLEQPRRTHGMVPHVAGEEQGDSLWLARAAPRAWLEQGKKISVKNAPTYFGPVAYEIVSDVDNGKINATVEMPARKAPKEVVLRFRHPKSAPIKAVTVNGKPWTEFNKDKETITLKGLTGNVAVTGQY